MKLCAYHVDGFYRCRQVGVYFTPGDQSVGTHRCAATNLLGCAYDLPNIMCIVDALVVLTKENARLPKSNAFKTCLIRQIRRRALCLTMEDQAVLIFLVCMKLSNTKADSRDSLPEAKYTCCVNSMFIHVLRYE